MQNNQDSERPSYHRWDTESRAAVKGAVALNHALDYPISNRQVFEDVFNIPAGSGYAMIRRPARSAAHDPDREDHRGRSPIIAEHNIHKMEAIVSAYGPAGADIGWKELGEEAGLDCCDRTVKKAMRDRGYQKCSDCYRIWLVDENTRNSLDLDMDGDEQMHDKSAEVVMGVTGKPGQYLCPNCLPARLE